MSVFPVSSLIDDLVVTYAMGERVITYGPPHPTHPQENLSEIWNICYIFRSPFQENPKLEVLGR